MKKSAEKNLFSAIKQDDVQTFAELVDNRRNAVAVRYGRFPLLSLCYLYKSRRIVRKYEQRLAEVSEYIEVDEPYEAYVKFRSVAGQCLRLYTEENAVVSPAEMLAITGDFPYLEAAYPRLTHGETEQKNIEKASSLLHGQNVVQSQNSVFIPKILLTKLQKVLFSAFVLLACAVLVFSSVAFSLTGLIYGGKDGKPVYINTTAQLATMLKSGGNETYLLTRDLVTDASCTGDFSGTFDGDGHSLTLSNTSAPLFQKLSGTVVDLNLIVPETELTATDNVAFIASESSGTIKNVSVTADFSATDTASADKLYISLFTYKNSGVIKDCTADARATVSGNLVGDTFFCCFSAVNTGTIENCSTTDSSSFSATAADMAAIAVENGYDGIISGCTNNAELLQTSSTNGWSPNTAGLVITNNGTLQNCTNKGNIGSSSSFELTVSEDNTYSLIYVYAAGIAINNAGTISQCSNEGNVAAHTANSFIYAAGIVSANLGKVENCINTGAVSATTADNTTEISIVYAKAISLYAAGIAAISSGNTAVISGCSAVFSLTTTSKSSYVYGAGIAAVSLSTATVENCYAKAELVVSCEHQNIIAFAAGITAYTDTLVKSCRSMSTVDSSATNAVLGGIIGARYFATQYDYMIYEEKSTGNAYVTRDKVTLGVAGIVLQSTIYTGSNSGCTAYSEAAFISGGLAQ